jgi:beta-galactosidase
MCFINNHFRIVFWLATALLVSLGTKAQNDKQQTFEIKNGEFVYNNQPIKIYSGEMHFARIPEEYWEHRLKMAKAMGLNTIATYAFWNYHNTTSGVWDFESGNHNIAKFIHLAQKEGFFVILRPGPYVCAEWDFGGYPWWLQKNKDLVVRANNQAFLDSCQVYFNKLAEQVKDLQVTHGGPIIMVQVENEFGSYVSQRPDIPDSEHQTYYKAIKQMLTNAGFDVPFFTSDGTWLFNGGAIPGILPTANGEWNIENLKKSVNEYSLGGPYMVAEYYPGWLDHWGEDFVRISPEENLNQVKKYLENGINFNFYMVHGGTNFGFTSGANYNDDHDIQPDITSYDYDAPISEAGWTTPKYMLLREAFMKYVPYQIPEIPEQIPVIELPKVIFENTVDFFDWKKTLLPVRSDNPLSFEDLNQGQGYMLYSRHFTQPLQGTLKIDGLRDYALVFINGKKVGELNRMLKKYGIDVKIPFNGTLDILVENMGRINYGAEIVHNTKGIISPVFIGEHEIQGDWEMYKVPMDKAPDLTGLQTKNQPGTPTFYSGSFKLKNTGDVFLDMRNWGKGIVFVNGINLGRYWSIGPQQTLYLPGCWLKKGENNVFIFEQQNDTPQKSLESVTEPILENLKPNF